MADEDEQTWREFRNFNAEAVTPGVPFGFQVGDDQYIVGPAVPGWQMSQLLDFAALVMLRRSMGRAALDALHLDFLCGPDPVLVEQFEDRREQWENTPEDDGDRGAEPSLHARKDWRPALQVSDPPTADDSAVRFRQAWQDGMPNDTLYAVLDYVVEVSTGVPLEEHAESSALLLKNPSG